MSAADNLAELIRALAVHLDEVVLIGGWAAWVYPRWAASTSRYEPLRTLDFDLALPPSLSRHEPTIGDLLAKAGFQARFRSDQVPPVTRYQAARFGDQESPIYAEFLVNYVGPPGQATTREVSGVSAQCLRYMEIAYHQPIRIHPKLVPELALPHVGLLVPHPANFLVHKLLVLPRRTKPTDRFKDMAYIYQVLRDTRSRWDELAARVGLFETAFHPKWLRTARRQLQLAFLAPNATGADDVAHVFADERLAPTAAEVRRVVTKGAYAVGLAPPTP